ncbi:MazG-like pyrophosphatase [Vibrio phage 159E36-2a]
MINHRFNNADLGLYVQHFSQWHIDRNLIDGATDKAQCKKLTEEFIEIYAAIHSDLDKDELVGSLVSLIHELDTNGRINACRPENAVDELVDGIGDFNVVAVNLLERERKTLLDSFKSAWGEIWNRGGKMINGIWVKESDLRERV